MSYIYYIKSKNFNSLPTGMPKKVGILYENGYGGISQYGEYLVSKADSYQIKIGKSTYELKAHEEQAEKLSTRKPHPVVLKAWNDRVVNIREAIQKEVATLDRYVNEDLKSIRTNMFVDPEYANVVETKLAAIRKELAGLDLEIDKLKDKYENVADEPKPEATPET